MRRPRASLSREAWWLLVISGFFALSIGLSNTFVNIYLWKVDRSYTSIGWYNFAVYVMIPVAFVVAGFIGERRHPVLTLRLGVALHGVFYALVLAGGSTLARLPLIPGVVMGFAAGFYWLSFNWLSLLLTRDSSRDRFYGLNGVVSATAGMAAPTVAGYVIGHEDRLGGFTGYHVIFGLSLALFAGATALSMKLHSKRMDGRLQLGVAVRAVRQNKMWRLTLLGCGLYGLREGVFLFLIGLLIYVATGSEMELGEFLLLQNAILFVAFYFVGRFTTDRNRLWVIGTGALGMAATALLFTRPITAASVIWYGALIAVFLPMFIVPLQGTVFNQISALDGSGEAFVEHIIAREVVENLGRVVGIAAFLTVIAVRPTPRAIGWFAVFLGFVQLGTWALLYTGAKHGQFSSSDHGGEGSGGKQWGSAGGTGRQMPGLVHKEQRKASPRRAVRTPR